MGRSFEERETTSDGLTIFAFAERKVDEIFQQYEREILGALFFLCGGVESATLAFFASLRERCRLEAQINEISNVRSWIFRTLYNEVVDYANKRRKANSRSDELDSLATSNGVETPLSQRYRVIRHAVLNLPFKERAVFLLRQNGDLTYEQIAQTVNTSVSDVKQTMNCALIELTKTLEGLDETAFRCQTDD